MYKMKRCPYCGRQIDMAAIGMKFKVAYGSPFRTCPKCHKEYIDRDYQEVALESAKAKAFRMPKVRPGILWFEVLLLCSLGMQLTGAYASMTTMIPILAVAVILLVWELHGSAKRQSEWEKELAKELEASKERLQDPAYLMELKKLDYPVTEDMIWQARNRVYGE